MSLIHISLVDLALALGFIAVVIVLIRIEHLGVEKALFVGAVRAMAQLLAVGYVLKAVFDLNHWYWVVLVLLVMTVVAAHTARKRQAVAIPHAFWTMAAAIGVAAGIVLGSLLLVILGVKPWYQPQYVVPLAGIIIASAMNTAALSVDRFLSDIRQNRPLVEAAVLLGATAKESCRPFSKAAVRAGMMPHINTMMVVGIVQLPGMMTGQILSGVAPAEAVRYQIVIIYCLVAGAAIASLTALSIVRRLVFNRRDQLTL
ncbi:MAG: iron export ABC transporter permease subunit FetB [Candidatus Eisenbacteria sp.]|nr:iron export ABC transporter permease subunit FetB [Candidatus Eisenbacteria bacterium]